MAAQKFVRIVCLFVLACMFLKAGFAIAADLEKPSATQPALKEAEGLRLTAGVAKTSFKPGEPIDLTLTLENIGREDLRTVGHVGSIELLLPSGEAAPLTLYGKGLIDPKQTANAVGVGLSPGNHSQEILPLSRMFDMSLEGKYLATVQQNIDSQRKATSKPLTITVGDGPALPTLWIIGDSTVRNGGDKGENGQWGWGAPLGSFFDPAKINVLNKGHGGRSSRTYYAIDWLRVVKQLRQGDYLIMQFGHYDGSAINDDSRARGTFRDNSEKTQEIDNLLTQKHEVVHSYGWYIRQMIAQARERGVEQVFVCSPIPRNRWTDGTIGPDPYGAIAKQAADQVKAPFIDLNALIIKKYLAEGQENVTEKYFPDKEYTDTDWAGAVVNAQCVIEGMKTIEGNPLVKYLLAEPPKELKNPTGKAR